MNDQKRVAKAAIQYASSSQFSCLNQDVREQIALGQVAGWIERQMPGSDPLIGAFARDVIREIRRHYNPEAAVSIWDNLGT